MMWGDREEKRWLLRRSRGKSHVASPGINTFSWSSTSVFMDSLPFGFYNGLCLADIVAQNVIFSTDCECADS
jgi:hypothetical protein